MIIPFPVFHKHQFDEIGHKVLPFNIQGLQSMFGEFKMFQYAYPLERNVLKDQTSHLRSVL